MKEDVNSLCLHQELRNETAYIHEQLHTHPVMLPLLSTECTIIEYKRVLTSFYIFYLWAEEISNTFAGHRFPREVKVLDWINADFIAMQVDRPRVQEFVNSTGASGALYEMSSEPIGLEEYIGYLYVKQGSQLGGQLISQYLSKSLSLVPGETMFLFGGHKKNTKTNWTLFLDYLSKCADSVDKDIVVTSAKRHFTALKQVLDTVYNQREFYEF